jgi:protein ImuB
LGARALAAQELRLELELDQGSSRGAGLPSCLTQDDASSLAPVLARGDNAKFARTLRLPLPMLDVKVFLKLLQLDLQAHPPGAPIVKIHLSAEPARSRATQRGLFLPLFPEPEKLELTLARIAGIVGEKRVGSVELLDTHREGAFAMRHFAPVEPEAKKSAKQKKDVSVQENGSANEVEENAKEKMSAVIALRLFRPPLRAVITLSEGKPVRMKSMARNEIAGEIVWGEIVWTAGPWRSSGDWSEQEGWSREEWDIAVPADNGLVLYRLVQDKLGGKWFVEGMYD